MSASIEVVRQAYEAFKAGDAEALIAVADPEIEFGTSAAAPGGTFRGHPGIRRYLKEIEVAFGDRWEAEIERIADAGDDRVILIARISGRARPASRSSCASAQSGSCGNGKLLRGTVYLDPHEALEAVEATAR